MLKNIPEIISPELMKAMMEMGHGDELVIADGNYPAYSQGVKVIDGDGHLVIDYLKAILQFFPLDSFTDHPAILMEVVDGDPTVPTVWEDYKDAIAAEGYSKDLVANIDRFDFYDRSKTASLIISTSDRALYGNIILKKGVV